MNKHQLQQGDVLLRRISSLPKGAKKMKKQPRGYVLAEGEATGHAHTIERGVKLFEHEGSLFVDVDKPATLKHEEHGKITVEPGIWQIGIVKEYDYFLDMSRDVCD